MIYLDLNVGVTVKNIGNYLKIPTRNSSDSLKVVNHPQNFKQTNSNTVENIKYNKQINTTNQNLNGRQGSNSSGNNVRLPGTDSVHSLPRIRLSS